ncbi:hypothetical protein DPMN_041997 [Dreissena polymorpha]|uniref:Uncharacterized protein n=1 Tax=Dreissena polymorpha TaxID=45954 RepID=A0A9D4CYR3_DREPO|nr:hypothetical protein DPMN_041997 [Dreissena polymorpha]
MREALSSRCTVGNTGATRVQHRATQRGKLNLQYQSPGIGHDRDRTMLSLLDSRSTSDHMATPVSRSLPDGIGQGHRPMPDHLASAIRSLSGDNTGHDMTGTSPGTLITDH